MDYWSARARWSCPSCSHIDSNGHCKLGKMLSSVDGREIFFLVGECAFYEGPLEVGD